MKNVFIGISSILALISPLIYARAVLRGEAKPHRTVQEVSYPLYIILINALMVVLIIHPTKQS